MLSWPQPIQPLIISNELGRKLACPPARANGPPIPSITVLWVWPPQLSQSHLIHPRHYYHHPPSFGSVPTVQNPHFLRQILTWAAWSRIETLGVDRKNSDNAAFIEDCLRRQCAKKTCRFSPPLTRVCVQSVFAAGSLAAFVIVFLSRKTLRKADQFVGLSRAHAPYFSD